MTPSLNFNVIVGVLVRLFLKSNISFKAGRKSLLYKEAWILILSS